MIVVRVLTRILVVTVVISGEAILSHGTREKESG
jgi:hypothetical protein